MHALRKHCAEGEPPTSSRRPKKRRWVAAGTPAQFSMAAFSSPTVEVAAKLTVQTCPAALATCNSRNMLLNGRGSVSSHVSRAHAQGRAMAREQHLQAGQVTKRFWQRCQCCASRKIQLLRVGRVPNGMEQCRQGLAATEVQLPERSHAPHEHWHCDRSLAMMEVHHPERRQVLDGLRPCAQGPAPREAQLREHQVPYGV